MELTEADPQRMARKAGLYPSAELKIFADLIRADERERCAKIAAATVCDQHIPTGIKIYGTCAAKAIRGDV